MWKSILGFIRSCVAHPKTSAAGLGMIATGIAAIAHEPNSLMTGAPEGLILGGIGLLLAPDANKTENNRADPEA